MKFTLILCFDLPHSVTVDIQNDTNGLVLPVPSGSIHCGTVSLFDRPAQMNGKAATVQVILHLDSYFLEIQVDEHSWTSVEETTDSLKLRACLLGLMINSWLKSRETDPLSFQAEQIVQASLKEIKRIEELRVKIRSRIIF